jgi:hypothetical protein
VVCSGEPSVDGMRVAFGCCPNCYRGVDKELRMGGVGGGSVLTDRRGGSVLVCEGQPGRSCARSPTPVIRGKLGKVGTCSF